MPPDFRRQRRSAMSVRGEKNYYKRTHASARLYTRSRRW